MAEEVRRGRERVVGFEVLHRPDPHAERAHGVLDVVELRDEIRVDALAGLVPVEERVAERSERVVEGDGDVGRRLVGIVEQREELRDDADRGLQRLPRRGRVVRTLGEVRAEELEGAVDDVEAGHGVGAPRSL